MPIGSVRDASRRIDRDPLRRTPVQRTLEGIRNCGILRQAKAAEIAAALVAR